jgi:hypothetical protein
MRESDMPVVVKKPGKVKPGGAKGSLLLNKVFKRINGQN